MVGSRKVFCCCHLTDPYFYLVLSTAYCSTYNISSLKGGGTSNQYIMNLT